MSGAMLGIQGAGKLDLKEQNEDCMVIYSDIVDSDIVDNCGLWDAI